MSELKTCPICYKEAYYYEDYENYPFQYTIMCVSCTLMTDGYKTKKEAYSAWNTRQPNPEIEQLKAEIAALKARLEPIKAVYAQNRDLYIVSEAMRNPNKPETRPLFKLWQAIKKAVEDV